ncbi:MAG: DUF1858 domain-containing protein [candidate division WOR-3 bacterium]
MKKITEDTNIEEILALYPDSVSIFLKYGIPAISCGEPIWGSIKENALKYGVKNLEELLEELNKLVSEKKLGISFKDFSL